MARRAVGFILGVGKHDKRIVFLLDIAKILSNEEAHELSRTSDPAEPQPT